MDLICEERASDSPFVERIWRSQSDHPGAFISMADIHNGIAVTRYRGRVTVTVRGPETRATPAYCPPDAEFFGIQFKTGTFMPHLPAQTLMDRRDINLPAASSGFWLDGRVWQVPTYENADTFVDWLVRDGLLAHEPLVDTALQQQPTAASQRTVQRRFLQATGLTQSTVHQIRRARYAVALLKQGLSILDTVDLAGYFDQPHLTRSLKHFAGQTPAQIIDQNRTARLSFLYKTNALWRSYDKDVHQLATRGA